jgi:hypothetical protein
VVVADKNIQMDGDIGMSTWLNDSSGNGGDGDCEYMYNGTVCECGVEMWERRLLDGRVEGVEGVHRISDDVHNDVRFFLSVGVGRDNCDDSDRTSTWLNDIVHVCSLTPRALH